MGEWLSTAALSELVGIPVGTLRQWRHHGQGPPGVRLGGSVRYRRSDVEEWIREQELAEQRRGAAS